MDNANLASAYLKYYHSQDEGDHWAFNAVVDICRDPIAGTEITIELIEACETDAELAYVAAGPVEDMLNWHGSIVIGSFEKAAKDSEKVRVALSGAWINEKEAVFPEWKRLMEKFGYWGKRPLSPLDRR